MKNVNIFLMTTTILLTGLIYLMVTRPNPIDQRFNALVHSIIESNELLNEAELLDQYPEINELKKQINTIKQMNYDIRQITQHPVPNGKEQSLQISERIKQLKEIKEGIKVQLDMMVKRTRMERAIVDKL